MNKIEPAPWVSGKAILHFILVLVCTVKKSVIKTSLHEVRLGSICKYRESKKEHHPS